MTQKSGARFAIVYFMVWIFYATAIDLLLKDTVE